MFRYLNLLVKFIGIMLSWMVLVVYTQRDYKISINDNNLKGRKTPTLVERLLYLLYKEILK